MASFSLITLSSCKDDKPGPDVTNDTTISVSGGASVELKGADIPKDITVTATEKATKDIIVNITSNAAAGEATIAPAQVTIAKGELSATAKITFVAAKFPKGTAQKKIIVTIVSPTEGVKLGASTTDFLVKGEGGEEMTSLSIAANALAFNTTTEAKTMSVTATLDKELAEDLEIAISYDESADALKDLFKEVKSFKIAKGQKTGSQDFLVPMGTSGKLVVNFSTTNKAIDLKTTKLEATFTADKPAAPALTLTGSGTDFNTTKADQPMTATFTLTKAVNEELVIALTYDGSTDEIKELFKTITSVRIAADQLSTTQIFNVPKGIEGKLVINCSIENTDVVFESKKLEANFTVDKPTLDITVNEEEFDTSKGKQTLTVTSTLTAPLAADLIINIAYGANTSENLKEQFKEVTSITIPQGQLEVSQDFEVDQHGAGKLDLAFTTENKGVILAPTTFLAIFSDGEPTIEALCTLVRGGNYLYTKQFKVGDYTSEAHTANMGLTDLTSTVLANIANGGTIEIAATNATSGAGDTYFANVWVDWDRNGTIGSDELVMTKAFICGAPGTETISTAVLTAPSGARSGKYAMRIGTSYKMRDVEGDILPDDGCMKHETFDFTDIIIKYTK